MSLLPISGTEIRLREPVGDDEIHLLEHPGPPVAALLSLACRLCPDLGAEQWEELPAAEIAAVALLIRVAWLGDLIRTESTCTATGCGDRIDVAFSIGTYLGHHRPRRFRGAVACSEDTSGAGQGGRARWFALTGTDVSFRLPTVGDLLAALESADAEAVLTSRCVRPATMPPRAARRIDRALTALAPSLAGDIAGECPTCGSRVSLWFDPVTYALAELRDTAGGLYADVSALASSFGWSERDILNLPRHRRAVYARLARGERAGVDA